MDYDTIHDVIFGVVWVARGPYVVSSRFGGRLLLFIVDDRPSLWTEFSSWELLGGRRFLWIVDRDRDAKIRIMLRRIELR